MDRERKLSEVTAWGAVANIFLAAAKLVAGIIGHSAAMIADSVHSFSDLVSDIIVFAMVRVSSKGTDKSHDYGHGKFETLATVAVSLLLLAVGARIMQEGVVKILAAIKGESLEVPGAVAFWAALISIAVKEVLYQWTARVGKRYNSPATVSNAWHHRSDAMSSVAAAAGIGCALLLGGRWAVLDPIVSCAISIFIIYVAVMMSLPAINELTEASLPEETENEIMRITGAVEGVRNVHALKTRKSGPGIIIDAHVVVDPKMSVADAHHITTLVENDLRQRFGGETQISLHIEPSEEAE